MTMGLTGKSWNNNELIVAYQNERSSGSVKFGVIGQTITNKGQICLTNQVYQQTSKIDGSGCVTAKKMLVFIFQMFLILNQFLLNKIIFG